MKRKSVRNTPSDPTVISAKITIAGQEYFLCWDFNAFAHAEALTKQNVLRALSFDNITAAELRALLYASLLKHQPEITLDDVGEMISDPSVALSVIRALTEAYYGAQPENATDGEPKNDEPGQLNR